MTRGEARAYHRGKADGARAERRKKLRAREARMAEILDRSLQLAETSTQAQVSSATSLGRIAAYLESRRHDL